MFLKPSIVSSRGVSTSFIASASVRKSGSFFSSLGLETAAAGFDLIYPSRDKNLKKLDSVFRTCYYVLFGFPIVGIFVIGSVIGFYLCMFRNALGLFLDVVFPHMFIEIPVYLVCASLGLMIAGDAKEAIFENSLEKTETRIRKYFRKFVGVLPVIIILLLISAYLETFA